MAKYALVAYKPNSIDTCRGCVMDRYDSDLILEYDLDIDQLINRLSEIQAYDNRVGEDAYETHYFPSTKLNEDGPWEETEEYVRNYIYNQVSDKVEKIKAQIKVNKETAKLKKEAEELNKKTREELELLKKLQEKYK